MIKGSAKKHKVMIILIILGIIILSGAYSALVTYLEHHCTKTGGWWNADYMVCEY